LLSTKPAIATVLETSAGLKVSASPDQAALGL
jgi:hypothetical protein